MEKERAKWIEVISVRLFSAGHREAIREIYHEVMAGMRSAEDEHAVAELYASEDVGTDWSIYLYRDLSHGAPSKSMLGLSIADAFRTLGLVSHDLWTMDMMKKDTHEEKPYI